MRAAKLEDVTKTTVTAVGLLAGVFAIVYAYRKQRIEEAGSRRADAEQLSKRYQDAAEQLGHEKAAVRLAGVYSMTRLADDWQEQRQTCISVLCAYLRMPVDEADERDSEVRRAIFAVIREHLLQGAPDSWSGLHFDFTGATFDDVNFRSVVFKSRPIFDAAEFTGWCGFNDATFLDDADFNGIRVAGTLWFAGVNVGGAGLTMNHVHVEEGWFEIDIKSLAPKTEIDFLKAHVKRGKLVIALPSVSPDSGAVVHIDELTLEVGGFVSIDSSKSLTRVDGSAGFPRVNATGWKIKGGHLRISKRLSDQQVINFNTVELSPRAVVDQSYEYRRGR
jgi:hypothetical protein